jgi:hypothetical protein
MILHVSPRLTKEKGHYRKQSEAGNTGAKRISESCALSSSVAPNHALLWRFLRFIGSKWL